MKDTVTITRDELEEHFIDEIKELLNIFEKHAKGRKVEFEDYHLSLIMAAFSAHVVDLVFNEEEQSDVAVH